MMREGSPRLGSNAGIASSALVALERIVVRKGHTTILEDIDFEVWPGEIVTLIGPNGAGKTTLIRTLLGLERPVSGQVARRSGLQAGYLPQRLQIDAVLPLSVQRLMTLSVRASDAEISAALDEVGGSALRRAQVFRLSGGELQRVLLARALLGKPDLLVLDEPMQGVDALGQRELYDLVARVRSTHGCAVVMISHDLPAVMSTTDRVVCLQKSIRCAGLPEQVATDPAYLEMFGKPVAFLAGREMPWGGEQNDVRTRTSLR